jgi:hypothetical protein
MGLPATPAERQRRYRARRRSGVVYVRGEVDADTLDSLIDGGLLAWGDQNDPDAVWLALIRSARRRR